MLHVFCMLEHFTEQENMSTVSVRPYIPGIFENYLDSTWKGCAQHFLLHRRVSFPKPTAVSSPSELPSSLSLTATWHLSAFDNTQRNIHHFCPWETNFAIEITVILSSELVANAFLALCAQSHCNFLHFSHCAPHCIFLLCKIWLKVLERARLEWMNRAVFI